MSSIPVNLRGAWDNATAYVLFDGVTHDDTTWVAIKPSTGEEPAAGSAFWFDAGDVWNDAGMVAITPKDNYDATADYEVLDLVKSGNTVWLAKKPSHGITPAIGDYWMQITDPLTAFVGATASTAGAAGLVPAPGIGDEEKVLYGNGDWGLITGGAYYGTSTTLGSVAAKVVTTVNGNFDLREGADVIIKFAETDTAGAITLAIDGSEAKAVYKDGTAITANVIQSTGVYEFIYNGTQYEMVGGSSGHFVEDSAGVRMNSRPNLQFEGVNVSDDSTNDRTVVHGQLKVCATKAEWDLMTQAQKDDPNVYWVRPWADNANYATDKTPVGTVLSMAADSTRVTSPFPTDDYLLCDGTVMNIADYPKLAEYIGDAYGSVNYFGGNGTTTFGLPNFTVDYPTNGVLVIKAQMTSTTIAIASVDDTVTTANNVWTAQKVRAEIDAAIASLSS